MLGPDRVASTRCGQWDPRIRRAVETTGIGKARCASCGFRRREHVRRAAGNVATPIGLSVLGSPRPLRSPVASLEIRVPTTAPARRRRVVEHFHGLRRAGGVRSAADAQRIRAGVSKSEGRIYEAATAWAPVPLATPTKTISCLGVIGNVNSNFSTTRALLHAWRRPYSPLRRATHAVEKKKKKKKIPPNQAVVRLRSTNTTYDWTVRGAF